MARKLSNGYVYKNQRLGKWRLAISYDATGKVIDYGASK